MRPVLSGKKGSKNECNVYNYTIASKMLPRAVLVLRELDDVVGEVAQLQVGEAVVAEVLEQARAARRRLVARHQRAHRPHAHAHADPHTHAAHATAH